MVPGSRSEFECSVVGAFDDKVHLVQINRVRPQQLSARANLQILILSENMRLVATNDVKLDTLPVNFVFPPDFEVHEHGYFMHVRYRVLKKDTLLIRNKLLAVNANGDIIAGNPRDVKNYIPPIHAASMGYSIISKGSTIFAAIVQQDSTGRQLSVRKTHINEPTIDQMEYGISNVRLSWPRIAVGEDSTFWIAGLVEQPKKYATDGGEKDMILLARMDTNLGEVTHPRVTAFPAPYSNRRENFIPQYVLSADSNLLIVSIGHLPIQNPGPYGGRYSMSPSFYDLPLMDNYYAARRPEFFRRVDYNAPILQSRNLLRTLRVSVAGPDCSIVSDTVIQGAANGATLELGNSFYSAADNGLILLCGQQFSATRAGIRYFFIDRQGAVEEKDLRVDSHYIFNLPKATRISHSSIVVPFFRKGRQGFLKLDGMN
jgi:hypothetical protein